MPGKAVEIVKDRVKVLNTDIYRLVKEFEEEVGIPVEAVFLERYGMDMGDQFPQLVMIDCKCPIQQKV